MARRVFWHIGLPKTGTTYLQDVLWSNREQLRHSGLLLPGTGHREHLWAALEVQERNLRRRDPRARGAWERLCAEIDATDGDVLLTHEFFCGASREQAEQAAARLAPAEIHLVVTARHAAAMLTAGWQEQVKNGGEDDIVEVAARESLSEFGWRTWDLHGVLERWGELVPPERVHVLPVPGRDEPADQHWHNLRDVLGLEDSFSPPESAANRSLGAVQVELLRRINAHLDAFRTRPVDRGYWIRGYLAERHLVQQEGERFGVPPAVLADCRARSERAVALIAERGYRVTGDPGTLLVPDQLPAARSVDTVTDAEMLDAATRLIAEMLGDLREQSDEARADSGRGDAEASALRRVLGRARRARDHRSR